MTVRRIGRRKKKKQNMEAKKGSGDFMNNAKPFSVERPEYLDRNPPSGIVVLCSAPNLKLSRFKAISHRFPSKMFAVIVIIWFRQHFSEAEIKLQQCRIPVKLVRCSEIIPDVSGLLSRFEPKASITHMLRFIDGVVVCCFNPSAGAKKLRPKFEEFKIVGSMLDGHQLWMLQSLPRNRIKLGLLFIFKRFSSPLFFILCLSAIREVSGRGCSSNGYCRK